ncbi:MAG: methylamine utilization protein [Acidobacteria bacterium]|nr:methylamine utilization protein [Acidobacteriota bacterium]
MRTLVLAAQALLMFVMFAAKLLAGGGDSSGTIIGRVRWSGAPADLSNFVIWIDDINGRSATPSAPAVMDQKDLRFVPHVLAIPVGTTVVFPNTDPVSHNVFSISEVKRFNLGLYGRSTVRRVTFDKPGVVELLCNVHLEMGAYIVVVSNGYFAQTSSDGTYRIAGVPAGQHRVRCWHERLPLQEQGVAVPENGSVTLDFFGRK